MDAGFDPDDFWHATPRYIRLCLDGAASRIERETRLAEFLSWQTAHLAGIAVTNPRKFPTFQKAFPGRKPKGSRRKTGAQIMDAMRLLTAATGGKVT